MSLRAGLIQRLIRSVLWSSLTLDLSLSPAAAESQQQQAYASIMKGVTELNFEGSSYPGVFILSGDRAFPLVLNSQGRVQAAASWYGAGRIVALCHETYLTAHPGLVLNAVTWLRSEGSDNVLVGVNEEVKEVAESLSSNGFRVKVLQKFSSDQGMAVYITDAWGTNGNDKELIAFMKAGGGVLMAAQAWHWGSQHPDHNALLQYWGNKVSAPAGVYFAPEYGERARLSVGPQVPPWRSLGLSDSFKDDLDALLKGVTELQLNPGSLGSEVLVHGRLSFPVAWDADGRVFMAGGYHGRGRFIVAGHDKFMADNEVFWENALRWLDQGRQGVVGVDPFLSVKAVEKSGFPVEATEFKADLSVFVCNSWRDKYIREMQEFVAEGGGLVLSGHAWTFTHRSKLNYLTHCPGNKVMNPMGVTLLSSKVSGGVHKVPDPSAAVKEHHMRSILDQFVELVSRGKELTLEQEKSTVARANDLTSFLQINNLHSYTHQQLGDDMSVTSGREKLLLSLAAAVYKAHPDPDDLVRVLHRDPPQLPTVQDQRVDLSADTGEDEEWLSTGLYLPPGMKTNITVPNEIVNKGWEVLISCQTDTLDVKGDLKRAPVVYEKFLVNSETLQVHNFWGGLIYLIAPPNTKLTGAEATVQRAVRAPYFKSGLTAAADWPEVRSAPAPWAELEFENVILTVPSFTVRGLDNIEELEALWDKIMRAIADLAVIPHKFKRKERLVCDVQISHGQLHAGYPVMGPTSKAVSVTSLTEIRKKGLWGPIHEFGHNQQRALWEFRPHTKEATCNLWSVYVHETVLGVGREEYAASLTQEYRSGIIRKYVDSGRNLDDWNTWVALETYLQLQERFGWDAFKKVFAAYHAMSENQVPRDNPGKMNLYAVTFSQAVGVDLTAFLRAWNWPISAETGEKLSTLQPWTDHPMVQYGL